MERAVICERTKLGMGWMQEGKAIARLLGIKGMISITPFSDFKGCFFVDTKEKAEWLQERTIVLGKFQHGWLELSGLPFHLWDETQLSFILQK